MVPNIKWQLMGKSRIPQCLGYNEGSIYNDYSKFGKTYSRQSGCIHHFMQRLVLKIYRAAGRVVQRNLAR